MQLIDTHCHLNFDAFDEDRDAAIARAAEAGISRILIPATDMQTCDQGIALASEHAGIWAAVGIHPNSSADLEPRFIEALQEKALHAKVIAIGEIGLDYHWDTSPKAAQRRAFEAQLELARMLELPVIIHNREATDDVLEILERWVQTLPASIKERPGVLHSFSASPEAAERALRAGFYLGFTGPITFKNADELRYIAARAPIERILVETDSPYLTPAPHRGKRNEPAYVRLVAERLAALRQIPIEAMAAQTTLNAETLFRFSFG
ncbi:MAG: TatD family hydrolase [Anaerolineae bacterium]|nr:TatD family hydrolase [Anaerolineae bacterium]